MVIMTSFAKLLPIRSLTPISPHEPKNRLPPMINMLTALIISLPVKKGVKARAVKVARARLLLTQLVPKAVRVTGLKNQF